MRVCTATGLTLNECDGQTAYRFIRLYDHSNGCGLPLTVYVGLYLNE